MLFEFFLCYKIICIYNQLGHRIGILKLINSYIYFALQFSYELLKCIL